MTSEVRPPWARAMARVPPTRPPPTMSTSAQMGGPIWIVAESVARMVVDARGRLRDRCRHAIPPSMIAAPPPFARVGLLMRWPIRRRCTKNMHLALVRSRYPGRVYSAHNRPLFKLFRRSRRSGPILGISAGVGTVCENNRPGSGRSARREVVLRGRYGLAAARKAARRENGAGGLGVRCTCGRCA